MIITEKLFGVHFPLQLEPVIYGITERMADDYHCGYWEFWTLSNGGFYMAPAGDRLHHVICDNCFEGDLSADALGITSCLYACSHLSSVSAAIPWTKTILMGSSCLTSISQNRTYSAKKRRPEPPSLVNLHLIVTLLSCVLLYRSGPAAQNRRAKWRRVRGLMKP